MKLGEFGIDLPEFDPDAQTPSSYLALIGTLIASRPEWFVQDTIYLATFAYSKLAMWRDLETIRTKGTLHPIVRTLAGDPSLLREVSRDPGSLPSKGWESFDAGRLDDVLDVKDQHTVLPADYSQLIAVAKAKSGSNLVIHGPPGTGKSQSIANVIATLIAGGKTVLFVSEKTAALDVVKRRLEEKQLGVFCLDMHSERGSKASVYEQLRRSLEDPRVVAQPDFDYERLTDLRDQLNRLVRALHKQREPLGDTVFQMHGRLAEFRDAAHVGFEVPDVGNLTRDRLAAIRERATRVAQRKNEFLEHWTSRWQVLKSHEPSLELAHTIRADTDAVKSAVLGIRSESARLAEGIGTIAPRNLDQVEQMKNLALHMSAAPGVPEAWLDPEASTKLQRRAETEATTQETRANLLRRLTLYFGGPLPQWDFGAMIGQLFLIPKEQASLRHLFGEGYSERTVSKDGPPFESVERLDHVITELLKVSCELTSALESTVPETLPAIRELASTGETVANLNPVPEAWLAPGGPIAVSAEIERSQARLQSLMDAENRLFSSFEPAILDSVDQETLVRYRTDHQSRVRRVFGSYRRDRKLLRSLCLENRPLRLEEELSGVELAVDVSRRRREWMDSEAKLVQLLGHRYQRRDTDWNAAIQDAKATGALRQSWKGKPDTLTELLTDRDKAAATRELSAKVADVAQQTIALLQDVSPNDLAGLLSGEVPLTALKRVLKESLPILGRLRLASAEPIRLARGSLGSIEKLVTHLEHGAFLRELEREYSKRSQALGADFGARFKGFDTDWPDIRHALNWAEELFSILNPGQITHAIRTHSIDPKESSYFSRLSDGVELAKGPYYQRIGGLEERFDFGAGPWESWTKADFDDVTGWANDLSENADTASDWLIYLANVNALEGVLCESVVDDIRTATDDSELIPGIVERRIAGAWLDWAYSLDPILAEFASSDHESVRARFRDLDKMLPVAARNVVRRRVFASYPSPYSTSQKTGQLARLRGEVSKKRRQMSVRGLFTNMPDLLKSLKPCFLMSPLAVSQFLPVSNLASETVSFDMVIFDEASQVFPEDAVPAILRGEQLVLAGDQKQLPPSNFWRRSLAEDDDSVDDDDDEPDADQLAGRDSILDVAVGQIGSLFEESHLNVHYRSKDERLIQFSNHYFYDDRLLTFPSPGSTDPWNGLHDVFISDGIYDASASRTNRVEADKTVELVFEHMRTRPANESLGVVALSRPQADLIERLIDERRLSERAVDERFSEDVDEPFFVKNLENVQGDERDHMILTVGYGPTAAGAVYNRFGPINREGGERRLNVAITRAKRRFTVVHSLKSSDISSETQGARLLRRFLEYVANPDRAIEAETTVDPSAEPESPFEEGVGRALERRGYRVARQVGVAGYRVDIAILSEDGSGIDLGIECDGATYHSAPAARDRDWLREEVLKSLGWHIHRVWSTSWVRDPEREMVGIDEAVAATRASSPLAMTVATASEHTPQDDRTASGPELSEASPTGTAPGFQVYQEASLGGLARGHQLQFETYVNLAPMILQIARIEGPIHTDVVIERIRVHYGMGRVRGNTRRKVLIAIVNASRKNEIEKEGSFIWAFDEQLDQLPRTPRPGESPRNIEHVPRQELERAVLTTVRTMFGGSTEDVVVQTARNLGYQRTGGRITQILGQTISTLLDGGKLGKSFDSIVPGDQ